MLGRATLALALLLIGAVAAAAQSGGTHNLVFTVKDLVFKVEDLMRVRETPTEVRIELPADILFDFDKFEIRPSAQIALQQAGQMVRTQAKGTVRIEGHTDAKGTPAYNQTLSARRAQSEFFRRSSASASRSASAVPAFADLLDDFCAEVLEIARIARGDDAVVGHHRSILPLAAGIDDVGLDRLVGGHLAALGEPGLDQQPGRVADRRHRLACVIECLDQLERVGVDAQQIGVDLAAGQHDGVIIVGARLAQRLVDLDRPAPILLLPALDLAGLRRHHIDRGAGGPEPVARHFEFRLLEAVGGENENALAVQLTWHDSSPGI